MRLICRTLAADGLPSLRPEGHLDPGRPQGLQPQLHRADGGITLHGTGVEGAGAAGDILGETAEGPE